MVRGNAYATTKAAIEAHTVNLGAELHGTGVTVNAYRPGGVDTAMQAWIRRQDPERIGAGLHERFNKNFAEGGSNYAGFRLSPFGTLTPVSGSTYAVPDGSGLGDVFFNAFGDHLIGTRTGTSLIDSFLVLPDGRLLAAPGSPFTGQGLGQLGAEFSPANPSQLFVSNAHNGALLGTVSAYHDSLLGQLSPIGSSPYADGQTAPCWVEISHDGRYLFAVNTGSGNISSYAINPGGSLP
jgi:hypothetical protein